MNGRRPLVKICGVTRPEDAAFAVEHGADMIGMVFAEESPRQVSLEAAREIAAVAHAGGVLSVGVFTTTSLGTLVHTIQKTGIRGLQVYAPFPEEQLSLLQEICSLIYAASDFSRIPDRESGLLLLDSPHPGSGQTLDWNRLNPPADRRWMLAGGLHPGNVREAIDLLNPYGVDVSSGVERRLKGVKESGLIRQFIEEVKR